jgi:perosamine synthetase
MNNSLSVPFHKASIGQGEIDAVVSVLKSGWLTTGKVALEFEKQCGAYIDNSNTLALSSGTAALSIAYKLSGFEGEKVIVPSYTFGSCVAELLHLKAKPILVDIDPKTMNLDIDKALDVASTYDARGIVAVHFAGQPCDMNRLEMETQKRGIALVDDACHAFGAKFNGRKIGSFRSLSAFSFYATKCITTAEGGLLSTYNDDQFKKARVLSLHGISKDAWKRYSEEGNWFYEIVEKGYKANMPDVLAAIGVAQVRRSDELLVKRKNICLKYDEAFSSIEELILPSHQESESSYHLYPLRLMPGKFKISRSEMISQLHKIGVHCSVHFIPIHMQPYFSSCSDISWSDLSNSEEAYTNEITLPLFPDMTEDQIDHVISGVSSIIKSSIK